MKTSLHLAVVLLLSLSAAALDDAHVRYVGGTVPGLTAGLIGRLDTTSETSLTFEQAGTKVSVPYASIESYEYSKDVTRHLGVLPAIAVGLMKMRRHSHFFRITYRDTASTVHQTWSSRCRSTCRPHFKQSSRLARLVGASRITSRQSPKRITEKSRLQGLSRIVFGRNLIQHKHRNLIRHPPHQIDSAGFRDPLPW